MAPKARYTKPGKPGRSIEEVMVQRRLDATDPTSWPNPHTMPTNMSLPHMSTASATPTPPGPGGRYGIARNMTEASFHSSQASEVVDYSSNMAPLKTYCQDLMTRNAKLEQQLAGTVKIMQKELRKTRDKATENAEVQKMLWMKDMDKALADQQKALEKAFQASRDGEGGGLGGEAHMSYSQRQKMIEANKPKPIVATESAMGKINTSMLEMDMKVVHLKEIFRQGDPMEERRISINKINAAVRGWLQRKRNASYQRGLREWKWLRCRQIVWLLDMNMGLQAEKATGMAQLKVMHNFRQLYRVYATWLHITRQALPVRRAMYDAAMAKAHAKDAALIKKVWDAFKNVTVGGKSTKQANAHRREMVIEIRDELSESLKAKGEIGIVPEEDIERVLYRRVLLQFLNSKRMLMMRSTLLNGFWKNVQMHRRNNEIALNHRLIVHAGKIFYAWSEWVFMVGAGLDRKRWSAPRVYEIHYNQKRVDNFTKNRLKKFIFYPWKEFYVMQHNVRKMLQRQLGRFVQRNFFAWRALASELRKLRVRTVDNWRGYGRYITQTPFQGWAQFVKAVKNRNNEQQRIVNSYLRWKWRQRIVVIMKRWRHQAIYGRIDGLYTRQMLIASLNEQKIMTAGLEKMMAAQTVEVDECRELTEREINKRKLLENRLKDSQEGGNKHKMYSHHAEQEMKRMEGIVEAVALLNPRQVEHLKRLQPQFQFKQRRVNIPKNEDSEDEEEEVEEEEEDEEEDDEGHIKPGTASKKKKKQSVLMDDDDDSGENDDVPSNMCPKCRQLLPGEKPDEVVAAPLSPSSAHPHQHHGVMAGNHVAPIGTHSGTASPVQAPGTPVTTSVSSPPKEGSVSNRISTSEPLGGLGGSISQHSLDAGSFENTMNMHGSSSGFPIMEMGAQPNVISDEDMVLLERVKWLIEHFKKAEDTNPAIPVVIPGEEYRTQELVKEEVEEENEKTETGDGDDDSDDEPAHGRPRGNIEDEMEVTKAKPKKIVKPKTTTKIEWTPGTLLIPDREPILPIAEMLSEEQVAILGPDGKMDTLLPGDPEHEPAGIDPEDTAARMLLGFMSFLQEGDVTTFAPSDRRAWTEEVLATVEVDKKMESMAEEEAKIKLAEESGRLHSSMRGSNSKRVSAATLILGGAKDWRSALLSLRTMFPGAGNYSGVGVELDSAESGMYLRVKDMRSTLDEVMGRQAAKFDQKLKRSRAKAHNREKLIIAARLKTEAEDAERRRIEAAELAEKERIKAEEEAKMAAMRAAKAARKALNDDSDSDSDEEEDELDLVNPYASLLGAELSDMRVEEGEEEEGEEEGRIEAM